MSVLKNPLFLAAKVTLVNETTAFLKEHGMDTDRGEWVVLIGQLRKSLQHKVGGTALAELLDLLADRVKCEWDDMPLEYPVNDPDYSEAKNRWLQKQDELITAQCVELIGSKFRPAPVPALRVAA
ncbi:hypothetical protein ACFY5D_03490 [Paeniglutamicibacter sp. NPDC012692]|uniref:hypothetical protein n=1 Tax=Paeniglutamicibacter sp. NPDC012692 TaxID=3364388 RepID=UPI00369C0A68